MYAEAMKAAARRLTTRGTITPEGGADIALMAEDIIDWEIDEGDEFPLGSVAAGTLRLNLNNSSGQWRAGGDKRGDSALIGAEVKLEVGILDGEYIYKPLGAYIVESVAYNEGEPIITINATDKLLTAMNGAFDDEQRYPVTLQTLFEYILTAGEVTLDPDMNTLACNSTVEISRKPQWPEGVTIRQALGYVCAVCGSFVRVGRNSKFQIVPVYTSIISQELDTGTYMELSDDEMAFDLNRVKIQFNNKESVSSAIDETIQEKASNTLTLFDNPLLFKYKKYKYAKTTDTEINPNRRYYYKSGAVFHLDPSPEDTSLNLYYNRSVDGEDDEGPQAIANGLKTHLTGLNLRGMHIRWRGDPTLEIGDRVRLTDRRGHSYETTVCQQTITYKNGLSAVIVCKLQNTEGLGMVKPAASGIEFDEDAAGSVVGDGEITTTKIANKAVTLIKLADEVKLLAYPIGAVYLSEGNTSPETLFGGTWTSVTPPAGISYAWKRTA